MAKFGASIEIVFEAEEIAEGDSCYKLDEIVKKIKDIKEVDDAAIGDGPDELAE